MRACPPELSGETGIQKVIGSEAHGFRNYASLSPSSRPAPCGADRADNGAGKTNLMEAVSLLTPGRGMRRAPYGDVIKAGSEPGPVSAIHATLDGRWPVIDIGTGVDGAGRERPARGCGSTARRRKAPTTARSSAAVVADPVDGRAVYRTGRRPAAVSRPAGAVGRSGAWRRAAELRAGDAQPQPAVVRRAGRTRPGWTGWRRRWPSSAWQWRWRATRW
jgi:hypothetical protein